MHPDVRKRGVRRADGGDEHLRRKRWDGVLRPDRSFRGQEVVRDVLPQPAQRQVLNGFAPERSSDLVAIRDHVPGHPVPESSQSDFEIW